MKACRLALIMVLLPSPVWAADPGTATPAELREGLKKGPELKLKSPGQLREGLKKGPVPQLKSPRSGQGTRGTGGGFAAPAADAQANSGNDAAAKELPGGLPLPGRGFVPESLKKGRPKIGVPAGGFSLPAASSGGGASGGTQASRDRYAERTVVVRSIRFVNQRRTADGWPEWDLAIELENTDRAKPARVTPWVSGYWTLPVTRQPIVRKTQARNAVHRSFGSVGEVEIPAGGTRTVTVSDGRYSWTACAGVWLDGPGARRPAVPQSGYAPERKECLGDPPSWRVTVEVTELFSLYDGDDEPPTRWNVCLTLAGKTHDCFTASARDRAVVSEGAGRRLTAVFPDLRTASPPVLSIRVVDRDTGLFAEDDVGEGQVPLLDPAWMLDAVHETADANRFRSGYLVRTNVRRVRRLSRYGRVGDSEFEALVFRKVGGSEEHPEGPMGYVRFNVHVMPSQ